MIERRYVLMSIKPQYAQQIKSNTKIFELRRIAPKVESGDLIVIYETSPVKMITAFFEVKGVLTMELSELWKRICCDAGVTQSEFDQYFWGKNYGSAIQIGHVSLLKKPKSLQTFPDKFPPPQSYRYLSLAEFKCISS